MAWLTVPYLADWCLIHLIDQDGILHRTVTVHQNPSLHSLMDEVLESYAADPDHSYGYLKVVKTGQTELIADLSDELLVLMAQNSEQLEKMRLLGLKSNLCVPLKARGQLLGTLTLATAESGRRYTLDDLSFAEDLAERIALAVDNARLYQQAQQALQQKAESLALLDAIFAAAPVAIGFLDRELRYVRVNQMLADINGFTIEEHLGRRFQDILPTGPRSHRFEVELQQVLETGEPQLNIEFSGEAPGQPGRFGYWLTNRYPVLGTDGQMSGVGIIIADITETKRTEQALRTSEERYRAFIEQSTEGIWRFELEKPLFSGLPETEQIEHFYRNAYLAECNNVFAQMYGYKTAEELIGTRLSDFLLRSEPQNLEYLQRFVHTGYRISDSEIREVDQAGNLRYFSNNLVGIVENGFLVRVWGTQRDVTERKQAEAMLRYLAETSSFLATSLEYEATLQRVAQLSVPHLADWCIVDILQPDGTVGRLPIAYADHSKADWVLKLQHYPPELKSLSSVAKVIRTGIPILYPEVSDQQLIRATRNAEHLQIYREIGIKSAIIVPLAARERILGAVTLITAESNRRYSSRDLDLAIDLAQRSALAVDNAHLYEAEQQARSQAEAANRIKDEFLAVLSHELRTPLNPVLGWIKLLRTRKFDEEKTANALETVERNAKLLSQLIEDLLDVSRILRGKLSLNIAPVNLVAMIEVAMETVRLAAQAKSIHLHFSKAEGEDPAGKSLEFSSPTKHPSLLKFVVLGDANRLQQVIWNLLSNAVKFTEVGGSVEVQLERVGMRALIHVRDTGLGIDADFLPYVFDYFRQADSTTTRIFGGLGLGLAIVRQVVELHGGTVQATSPGLGQGATFTVALPLQEDTGKAVESTVNGSLSTDNQPLLDLRILIVDDDTDTLELLEFMLSDCGALVRAVKNAIEALQVFTEWRPDIVLSDIGMPEMDGYMLVQAIRKMPTHQGGSVPVIALTAYAGDSNREKVLAAGFQEHIAKPVEPADLVALVVSLAGRP